MYERSLEERIALDRGILGGVVHDGGVELVPVRGPLCGEQGAHDRGARDSVHGVQLALSVGIGKSACMEASTGGRKGRLGVILLGMLGVWACARSESTGQIDRDTLSQRQKDSIVSTMPIPGAARIRDAQRAQDAAAERNRILDSIASGR